MNNIRGYTGGENKKNRWPHPTNQDFNDLVRNTVKIYGIGSRQDQELLKECKNYLSSRIEGLIDHKIRRDTEEHYRVMKLTIDHGFKKNDSERQKLIRECSYAMCVGEWSKDPDALQQYRMANTLGKQILEMRYEAQIPLNKIIRYLQPVRPIKDNSWDETKQDDILIFETSEGLLELMDGNHRHEFANRVGGVSHLSGWIIKQV
jgi:hypothetical protein|tara:strand:+ start:1180 stop:1794 length:615 start_codon:yes stop_codon:yes gene_type:complete